MNRDRCSGVASLFESLVSRLLYVQGCTCCVFRVTEKFVSRCFRGTVSRLLYFQGRTRGFDRILFYAKARCS